MDLFGGDSEIEQKAACAEVLAGHFTTRLISILADSNESGANNQCKRNWGASAVADLDPSATSPGFDCLIAVHYILIDMIYSARTYLTICVSLLSLH